MHNSGDDREPKGSDTASERDKRKSSDSCSLMVRCVHDAVKIQLTGSRIADNDFLVFTLESKQQAGCNRQLIHSPVG